MISLIVESLATGNQRLTVRQNGRTMEYADHATVTKEMCLAALSRQAFMHQITVTVFDFTFITLNDAAKVIMQ